MKTLSRQIPLLVLCALVLGIGAVWAVSGWAAITTIGTSDCGQSADQSSASDRNREC